MATNKNNKGNTYSPNKGLPTDTGHSKAETKNMPHSKTDLQQNEELREKYVKDVDEPADHLKKNPNRNPIKEGIDNNKYN